MEDMTPSGRPLPGEYASYAQDDIDLTMPRCTARMSSSGVAFGPTIFFALA